MIVSFSGRDERKQQRKEQIFSQPIPHYANPPEDITTIHHTSRRNEMHNTSHTKTSMHVSGDEVEEARISSL
jgi:hypothetical protein